MNKKIITIMFIAVISFLLGMIGYKTFLYFHYKLDTNEDYVKLFENKMENITVSQTSGSDSEFLEVKYKMPEGDFKENDPESSNTAGMSFKSYELSNYNKVEAVFRVGEGINIYEALSEDDYIVFGEEMKKVNAKKLFEKFNINSMYDYQKYLIENYNKGVNWFSSRNKIQMNYLIKFVSQITLIGDKIALIDGDLKGYLVQINNAYEVQIFKDDKIYFFLFMNGEDSEYFNLDTVLDFIKYIEV